MGLIVGFYSPIQKRWRNWDCRSQFFSLAVNVVNYAKYFDKPYEFTVGGSLGSLIQLTFTGFAAMNTYTVCNAQYEGVSDGSNYWILDFETDEDEESEAKAGYTTAWEHPMVTEEPIGNIATTLHAFAVVNNLRGAIGNFGSHYYYFYSGLALGGFFG